MSGHTLRVFLHRDTACVRAVCHEPDGASCRMQCQANCEDFCANPDAGDDDEIPLHDGMAIEVTWDGERYVWSVTR
jgi:ATP-dependent DNA ligase